MRLSYTNPTNLQGLEVVGGGSGAQLQATENVK